MLAVRNDGHMTDAICCTTGSRLLSASVAGFVGMFLSP
jgi:hypothetical protein